MRRGAWAVGLAFLVHLVFFLVQLPEQEEAELRLTGSTRVSVRLARFGPTPKESGAPEQEKQEPVREPEKMAAPVPEEETVPPVSESAETVVEQKAAAQPQSEQKSVAAPEAKPVVPPAEPVEEPNTTQVVSPTRVEATTGPHETVADSGPITPALVEARPLATINRPPAYPPLARRRGWQGTVVLEVDVGRAGQVHAVRIRKSSSYSLLDREAVDAVRKWQFKPGSRNGEAMESKVLVPVHFMLQEN